MREEKTEKSGRDCMRDKGRAWERREREIKIEIESKRHSMVDKEIAWEVESVWEKRKCEIDRERERERERA